MINIRKEVNTDAAKPSIIKLMNYTPDRSTVYILRGKDGDMLIDTGFSLCRKAVAEFVSQYNVKWIFLTHGHLDHAWNAAYLKKKYGCKVIIHEKDREMLEERKNPELKPTNKKYKRIVDMANTLIKKLKMPVCKADYLLTDNDTGFLRKLGFDADIIMLPGHTPGSIGISTGNTLYAGDACSSIRGGQFATVFLGVDVDEVLESEKKIKDIKPAFICAGHGNVIAFG
ncbi:MAG: MBL fold metallo-hydrolase [Lachnospiraceae bacterium]|nr:MBL fold metallo-hydrolase [Lachnospiraceae bacterium]